MPKDDSAFTWFCTEMTDILEIFQIAKNQNQLMLHPDLIYLVAMQLKKYVIFQICFFLSYQDYRKNWYCFYWYASKETQCWGNLQILKYSLF